MRNLIRENKIAQINSTLQTGQTHGMQTLDNPLQALVRQGVISPDVARSRGSTLIRHFHNEKQRLQHE